MRRRLHVLAVAFAAAFLANGCGLRGLSFVKDDRVRLLTPSAGDSVALPLHIDWSAKGYDGYFAVFVDSHPMRPGRTLASLVPDNDPCRRQPLCPDQAWLAQRFIFATAHTELTIPVLPDKRHNMRSKDRHELTIVLLDKQGHRVGETALVREFVIDRDRHR
jgi:hypothetical protein